MECRLYRHADRAALYAMHRRQCDNDAIDYVFADPEDPRQLATLVAEVGGKIVGCATGRKVIEGYTTLDPAYGGTDRLAPLRRWGVLRKLISESARVCHDAGYGELLASVSPDWRGYSNRLISQLGFTRDLRQRLYLDLCRKFGGT